MSEPVARLLVTGAGGQLGADLVALAGAAGTAVTGYGSAQLDITDADAVRAAVAGFAAAGTGRGVVINAAAYTAVDQAETDTPRAFAVNGAAPGLLAAAAARHGLGFVHVSTDYVFDGTAQHPYRPDDPTGPRSVYGASKLAGEQAVRAAHPDSWVVRTAWVYGLAGTGNFVRTMAALEASRPTVAVVTDQVGSPTWSADLAAGLLELAGSTVPGGVLHATNGGSTSWYEFARAVFAELGADPGRVQPTTSAAFVRPAPRPAYSVLSGERWQQAGLTPLRPWREALTAAFGSADRAFRPADH